MTFDATLSMFRARFARNMHLRPTLAEIDYTARVGGFAPRSLWEALKAAGVKVWKGPR